MASDCFRSVIFYLLLFRRVFCLKLQVPNSRQKLKKCCKESHTWSNSPKQCSKQQTKATLQTKFQATFEAMTQVSLQKNDPNKITTTTKKFQTTVQSNVQSKYSKAMVQATLQNYQKQCCSKQHSNTMLQVKLQPTFQIHDPSNFPNNA